MLKPVLDATAPKVASKMKIGIVDATANSALKTRFAISGFPTLKYRRDGGEVLPYSGDRQEEDFVRFATRMTEPPVTEIADAAAMKDFLAQAPVVFIHGTTVAKTDAVPRLTEAFAETAALLQATHSFGIVRDPALVKGFVDHDDNAPRPAPFVVRAEREAPEPFEYYDAAEAAKAARKAAKQEAGDDASGKSSEAKRTSQGAKAMRRWVEDNQFESFPELGSGNFRQIAHSGRLLVVAAVDPDNAKATPAFLESVRRLADRRKSPLLKATRGRLNFGWLDGVRWGKFIEQFNVHAENLPAVFVLNAPESTFYEDVATVDEEDEIETFLNDVVAGKVQAQREGFAGLPGRLLDAMQQYAPYSYIFIGGNVLVLGYLLYLCCWSPSVEDELEARAAGDLTGFGGKAAGVHDKYEGDEEDEDDEDDEDDDGHAKKD